jgi:hypothetical protein
MRYYDYETEIETTEGSSVPVIAKIDYDVKNPENTLVKEVRNKETMTRVAETVVSKNTVLDAFMNDPNAILAATKYWISIREAFLNK